MEVRVYIFAGFLDSGKTTFINDTLMNPDFYSDEDILLISFEEGAITYDETALNVSSTSLVQLDHENFTTKDLTTLELKYRPTQIIIEANGMMDLNKFVKETVPKNWNITQVLTTFDTSTFLMYLNNMRSLIYGQVLFSDLVIFNRYDNNIKKSMLRNNIKAINSSAQIIYEHANGVIDALYEEELPFDISSNYLHISDHDFGIFCMDAMESPRKYKGKRVKIKGKFIGLDRLIPDGFILGRHVMVCCEDDTSLIGLVCISPLAKKLIPDEWIVIEGLISIDYDSSYQREIPVLTVENINVVPPLENQYITFD